MADTVGEADLRAENVSKVVTGFALEAYKFKSFCLIQKSSAWKETYFQESKATLTGGTGSSIEQVPRGANFPYLEESWTEASKRQKKYGGEGVIFYEDKKTNDIDVIGRTLMRVAEAVAAAVDAEIWDVTYENGTGSLTNKLTITAGHEWDAVTIGNRDPIQNLLDAQRNISIDNYDPYKNATLWINPTDYANLLGNPNVRNSGVFWTADPTKKGTVGMICGMPLIVSNNVTTDWAAIVINQIAVTWKSVVGLTTVSIENPGIDTVIRSWEIGCAQLKNPEAVCLISGTKA